MSATLIPVLRRTGESLREHREPGLTTTVPGLYLRRQRWCGCDDCQDELTTAKTCARAGWEWFISAGNGYKAHTSGFDTKQAAAEVVDQLARFDIDWTAPIDWFREHANDLHVRAARDLIHAAWVAAITTPAAVTVSPHQENEQEHDA